MRGETSRRAGQARSVEKSAAVDAKPAIVEQKPAVPAAKPAIVEQKLAPARKKTAVALAKPALQQKSVARQLCQAIASAVPGKAAELSKSVQAAKSVQPASAAQKPRERTMAMLCTQFRTYNPSSRTYRGYDGETHSCR